MAAAHAGPAVFRAKNHCQTDRNNYRGGNEPVKVEIWHQVIGQEEPAQYHHDKPAGAGKPVTDTNKQANCNQYHGPAKELDLSQADIQGTVVLEMTQVLGGAKLIVPSHWYIKNESNAVFGGVADKRQVRGITPDPNRTLVIKGISILGGLEIRNY